MTAPTPPSDPAGPGIHTGHRHSTPGADSDTVRRSHGRADTGGHTPAQ